MKYNVLNVKGVDLNESGVNLTIIHYTVRNLNNNLLQ